MKLINFLKMSLLPILVAFEIYLYNCYIGSHGVYLYDFAIPYNMGWLIFNGWIPFVDFKMPLMPLSGILTSLSFSLFGVSYYSAVKLAGIVCAMCTVYMGFKLQKHIGYYLGYIAAFLIVLSTIPVHGTFYYNHLNMLLFSIYLILMTDYILEYKSFLGKKETISSLLIYFVIALILSNKLHIGILSGLLFVGLEVSFLLRGKIRLKDVALNLFIRILPLTILVVSMLIWVNFNILDLVDNLFKSAHFFSSSYVDIFMARMGSGTTDTVFSSVKINIYLTTLISVGLVCYHIKFCKKNILATRLLYVIVFSLLVQILSFAPSAEAPTIDVPFIMVFLIMIYIYFTKTLNAENFVEIEKIKFFSAIVIGAVFITCATFMVHYSQSYLRKSFNEAKDEFSLAALVPKNEYISEVEFFSGVKINHFQQKNFDYLNNILKKYSSSRIFFGPELEMFYSASKRFQPPKWPIWIHSNVSYDNNKEEDMREIVINQNYDLIILSKGRYVFTNFLNDYILENYSEIPQKDSEMWIRVFVRKSL